MSKKTAEKWKSRFTKAEEAQTELFTRASKFYDILYAVQNTTNIAPWRSKVFIPILASKAWDLISRLSNVTPYFQTKVEHVELEGDFRVPQDVIRRQKRLDAKLRKDYLESGDEPIKFRVSDTLIDATAAGTGWGKISWEVKTEKVYKKQIDGEGMIKNPDKDEVDEFERGYNCFEPLNFFNVFVSPGSPSWGKASYIIVRYFKPFHELESDGKYNLKDLSDSPADAYFDGNNEARNRIVNDKLPLSQDETVPTATIYECYEKRKDGIYLTTYAEGKSNAPWVEIRGQGKRYWHNYYPIIPFYIRKKTFSPWGESLFENNATLQYATNDLFNHYLDNLNVSLDSMIMYEDGTLTSDFMVEPGGEITYTGEVPKQFKFPEPNPAQITMVANMIEKAIEVATVPQYISGVPDSTMDKTAGTAKGISLITEAATEKIGFMKDNYKQSMSIVGKIMLSNLAQFNDKTDYVEYRDEGKVQPDIVSPADYQGPIRLTIDDDSVLPLTKEERRKAMLEGIAQMRELQKAAVDQATYFKDPNGVPKIKYGEIMDDVVGSYFPKDTQRYVELVPAQPLPREDEGGGDQPTGQDSVTAALQGAQGAGAGIQSAGNGM